MKHLTVIALAGAVSAGLLAIGCENMGGSKGQSTSGQQADRDRGVNAGTGGTAGSGSRTGTGAAGTGAGTTTGRVGIGTDAGTAAGPVGGGTGSGTRVTPDVGTGTGAGTGAGTDVGTTDDADGGTDAGGSSDAGAADVSVAVAADTSAGGAAAGDDAAGDDAADDAVTAAGDDAAGDAKAGQAAVARIMPSKAPGMDDVAGTVTFTPAEHGVMVHAEITGLSPNGTHGFHVHQKGDLSAPDLASAGPHFDPGDKGTHGGPETDKRHEGDLGNLKADADGKATYHETIHGLSLTGESSIIGKSVIIHEKADDLKTDPAGNSGPRIAGGVIERQGAATGSDPNTEAETAAGTEGGTGGNSEAGGAAAEGEGEGEAEGGVNTDANTDQAGTGDRTEGPDDGVASEQQEPLGEKDANNPAKRRD